MSCSKQLSALKLHVARISASRGVAGGEEPSELAENEAHQGRRFRARNATGQPDARNPMIHRAYQYSARTGDESSVPSQDRVGFDDEKRGVPSRVIHR